MATGSDISAVLSVAALVTLRPPYSQYSRDDEVAVFVYTPDIELSGRVLPIQWESLNPFETRSVTGTAVEAGKRQTIKVEQLDLDRSSARMQHQSTKLHR